MIRPLRRRHRLIWIVLAITLPIVLAAAVHSRRVPGPMDRLPDAARGGTAPR